MIFDPSQFLDQSTDQASERRAPLPATDYNATISDATMVQWESKDKVDENGQLKSGVRCDITLNLDLPPDIQSSVGIQKMTLRDGILLDLNEGKTAIDYGKGKNNRLRAYRDATGLNNPGQAFSVRMLIGRTVRVRVAHEEYQGNLQERVGAIAKAV